MVELPATTFNNHIENLRSCASRGAPVSDRVVPWSLHHSAPPRLQSASTEGEASCLGSPRPLDAPPVPAAPAATRAVPARLLAEERRAHDGRFGAGGGVGELERLHEIEAVGHHLVQQLGRAHAPEEGGHQRPSACQSEAPSSVGIKGTQAWFHELPHVLGREVSVGQSLAISGTTRTWTRGQCRARRAPPGACSAR